jgi:hypothetical protein
MEVRINQCIAQSCGPTEIAHLSPGAKDVTSILGKLSQQSAEDLPVGKAYNMVWWRRFKLGWSVSGTIPGIE